MVVFDTSFLSLAFDSEFSPPIDPATGETMVDCKGKIEHLISSLAASKSRILIPTPVLAEFMIRGGPDKEKRLSIITNSKVFVVAPFDLRSAVECSLIEDEDTATKRLQDENVSKAKIKFDRQILAIALTRSASTIFTGDKKLAYRAQQCGLSATLTWQLDSPPTKPQLTLPFPSQQAISSAQQ